MYMRFKEQQSIDTLIKEATDILLRVNAVGHRDPANVEWDIMAGMLFSIKSCIRAAADHTLHLQGWARTGKKGSLKEIL